MGLLTNPNASSPSSRGLLPWLQRHALLVSGLLYWLGLAWFLVLAHPDYSHKTYFSENALLPGLVRGEFNQERHVQSYLEDLRHEAEKYPNAVPFPWLEARLRQLGLEVYTHNFTLKYPLGKTHEFSGQNIYAILRAPRASSTEALVLSVPYRPPYSLETGTDASLAMLLATAKFFRRQNYWAKDLIFLITQHEQLGVQAWLEAYHQRSCGGGGVLNHGDLEARAGAIQAAVNLEMADTRMTHFNVKVEGLNGQLPNLDLVNMVNRLCMREGVGQLFQGVEDPQRSNYQRSLQTLLTMAAKQATGVPTGNHGLFHRFGIEALTLESVRVSGRRRQEVDMHTVGRVVEGIFRSLNNLLERFHQSFFFYLLPSSNRYVSIGMYMPAFGVLASALLVTALGLWFDCTTPKSPEDVSSSPPSTSRRESCSGSDDDSTTSSDGSHTDNDVGEEDDASNPITTIHSLPPVLPPNLTSFLPLFLFAHLFGLTLYFLPRPASLIGVNFGWETDDSIVRGLLGFLAYTLILPRFLDRFFGGLAKPDWALLKCVTLLELATLAFTLALSNFSLAFFVSAAYVPLALLSAPSKSRIAFVLRILLALLTNPLALLALACAADTFRVFPERTVLHNLATSAESTKRALTYSITDGMIYGSVNFTVMTVFLFPCWYLLWCLNFARDDDCESSPQTLPGVGADGKKVKAD